MCWGVPAKVREVKGLTAIVDFGEGSLKEVVIAVDEVKEGDLVVVHAGAIVGKMSGEELTGYLELFREMVLSLSNDSEEVKRLDRELHRYKEYLGVRE